VFTRNKYMLTRIVNGVRYTFVRVQKPNSLSLVSNLAPLAAVFEDHQTTVAPVLPADIFDWDQVAA